MRQLATVQKILSIESIPGYDRVEYATILGWHCVVKRGEFKPGDLAIYLEVDSVCPAHPAFEFLAKYKYRVKTQKLCKVLSQGLVLSMADAQAFQFKKFPLHEGDDVTDALGIVKYDPELAAEHGGEPQKDRWLLNFLKRFAAFRYFMRYGWFRNLWIERKAKGGWPSDIPKTDEIRIQSVPWLLEKYKGKVFRRSTKMDGQSGTYFLWSTSTWFGGVKDMLGVCSRTIWKKTKHPCSWWAVADKYDMLSKLKMAEKLTGKHMVFQGEIVGPGVQGNKYARKDYEFYVFNVLFRGNGSCVRATPAETKDICGKVGLPMVPELEPIVMDHTVDQLVELSKGDSMPVSPATREGVVYRTEELIEEHIEGGYVSFKVLNPLFDLEHDK